ncbi:hypothetical protein ACJQWK_01996 [Exserohilum turcicum]
MYMWGLRKWLGTKSPLPPLPIDMDHLNDSVFHSTCNVSTSLNRCLRSGSANTRRLFCDAYMRSSHASHFGGAARNFHRVKFKSRSPIGIQPSYIYLGTRFYENYIMPTGVSFDGPLLQR